MMNATTTDATQADVTEYSPEEAQKETNVTIVQSGIKNKNAVAPREGVLMPPSKNVAQRRGRMFSIQQPQDLLDFVIEDERLSVVKVYASWCKTCKVFDVRYRKLASQFGDEIDSESGSEITKIGRVRFAEMQYDNPNNEEMCKLLNATKLPYILMYKGSKGKVADFQCGPAKFQMLIDAVNEYADPAISEGAVAIDNATYNSEDFLQDGNTTTKEQSIPSSSGKDTIDGLKQQLSTMESEKIELFETMKAQIDHDKEYIEKLEAGVKTQRSMLEAKDSEISNITTIMEQQQSMLKTKETEMLQQTEDMQQAKNELSVYKSQIDQLSSRLSEVEDNITSLEVSSTLNEKSAKEKEQQLIKKIEEWKGEKEMYERERNSLRMLSFLAIKRVGRGARNLLSRVRRKTVNR